MWHFETISIPRYLALKATIFWSLIFLAWLSYPAEHAYSIMSHTFSFLGSWNPEHNPEWWWVFSIAMVFWGVSTVPLVLYIRRRFLPLHPIGANVGAVLMGLGCLGVVLVGLIPDVRDPLYGDTRWTDVHEKAAILVGVGFALGILWHGMLLLRDRWKHRHFEGGHGWHARAFVWPFALWTAVVAVAVANQVRWGMMYEARKAAATEAGEPIGSSWGESLHTVYAFPLWENVVIYALYAFLIWFTFCLYAVDHREQA